MVVHYYHADLKSTMYNTYMTWEDIKQRKEDSIRESTNNPMSKPFEVNGKVYNSYTEWSNSDDHKELLK